MLIIVPEYNLWFKEPPLGALYIASVLRNSGEPVDFIDLNITKDKSSLYELVKKHEKIGISANIAHAASGIEIAKKIKSQFADKKLIWGGPYASVEYRKLIPEYADIVVIGEGEEQILKIAKCDDPNTIDGIAFIQNNEIEVKPKASYIDNLNELPFPAWDMISDVKLYDKPGLHPAFTMITQRGCPYHCINCTKFIHGDKYRTRSIDNVIAEMEYLLNTFGCKEIHIWDDNFTLIPDRVKKMCKEIISRGLGEKIRFALPNGIRADICDEEMFSLMRKAGFYYVNVAIESGDQEVINKLGKRLELTKVPKTVKTLNELGFRIGLFFIMGLPFETEETLKKTVTLAASLPAHHAHFFRCTPFPGTKLFDMTSDKNNIEDKYMESKINYDKDDLPATSSVLSDKVLRYYHHLAYRKFYLTPSRIPRIILKLIEERTLFNDLCFLLKNGIKIITHGHR